MTNTEDIETFVSDDVAEQLRELLEVDADEAQSVDLTAHLSEARPIRETGFLTSDQGFVVKLANGQSFMVTVQEVTGFDF